MGAKMKNGSGRVKVEIILEEELQLIAKSHGRTQLTPEDAYSAGNWIEPPVIMEGLTRLVTESSILPQCIRAYKNNIAGFGIAVRYSVDEEETPEMAAEYTRMQEIIELLNTDCDTKKIFEDIIEARETYGIAYLEVIRNLAREVQQIDFIRDTASVRKTQRLLPYIETNYYHHGEIAVRKKKFRMYQQLIGGEAVYF